MYSEHYTPLRLAATAVNPMLPNPHIFARARRSQQGFTLIELMIVVVIVAILASIAIPSYREQVLRGHRADAQQTMLVLAHTLERRFTLNAGFDLDGTPPVVTIPANVVTPQSATGTEIRYTISFAVAPTTYVITATPANTQQADRCGSMSINAAGVRTSTAPLIGTHGTLPTIDCWRG
jgi:type IV pilus assembly protein PilE